MRCPFCQEKDTAVKDSRETDKGKIIRRRRHCKKCGGRFTTFETIQIKKLVAIKRNGSKRAFDPSKVQKSITTALRKRNISDETIIKITDKIVLLLESRSEKEISTRKIGNLIMRELAKIDPVAYIRFASVYKEFSTVQDFAKFISKLTPE